MKKLVHLQKSLSRHWVGDGFPVRTIFTYNDLAHQMSPFLLMDYAGPAEFKPSEHIRGVDEHPHRGFETVTIVYEGEVEHRDSAGGGGIIKANDVQWMTAASGLVHEEKHGKEFARQGGAFEMVQLWVNLPRKNKMDNPRYQGISSNHIPKVELPYQGGFVRVIAGEYEGKKGPAKTFSSINVWDVRLNSGAHLKVEVKPGDTTSFFVLSGQVRLMGHTEVIQEAQLAVLDRENSYFEIEAQQSAKILVLTGTPLNEPIVGYGPFVMSSEAEIKQAFIDFQNGRMGKIENIEGSEL